MRFARFESPPLNPDPETARRWLDTELARPEYLDRPSLWQELQRWLLRHVPSGDDIPGGSITGSIIVVTLLLLTVVVIVLSVGRWRAGRVERGRSTEIFEDPSRSAAEHRGSAQAALADGEYADCILESFRALARGLQERTIIADRPGLTAAEVSVEASKVFPQLQLDLESAARTFNEVIYGDVVAARADAETALRLEGRVAAMKPDHAPTPAGVG